MAQVKGGWSYTAYANNEPFPAAYINSFSSVFSNARMENMGTYPGNALNKMIEWEDSEYLERGNIAILQSHGNIYGPDLEYIPRAQKNYWSYKWGDQRKLQWVAIGGCDCLGLTRLPNGEFSRYHPRASRWNGVFRGISGILGYSSDSWYQKNNLSLASRSGAVFANSLLNRNKFFDAWIAAADYLHRSLSRRAEAIVFASSRQALNDNLVNFNSARPKGLDESSITIRMVGSGSGPQYGGYCPWVDYNGTFLCNNFSFTENYRELSSNLFLKDSIKLSHYQLPSFKIVEWCNVPTVSKDLDATPVEVKTDPEDQGSPSLWEYISEEINEKMDEVVLNKNFNQNSGKIFYKKTHNAESEFNEGYKRFVEVDGIQYEILLESGISHLRLLDQNKIYIEERGNSFEESDIFNISLNENDFSKIFHSELISGAVVNIEDVVPVYSVDEGNATLSPKFAIYYRIVFSGFVQNGFFLHG